jgi:hypothetical protein
MFGSVSGKNDDFRNGMLLIRVVTENTFSLGFNKAFEKIIRIDLFNDT